jgi:hypothetical protein
MLALRIGFRGAERGKNSCEPMIIGYRYRGLSTCY